MRYSQLTPQQRIEALLDPGDIHLRRVGAMLTAGGVLQGQRVRVAASDPAVVRGAIGVAEARGLEELLRQARVDPKPVLLLLDSAGARVDEGLPALGAFRNLFREALLAKLARVPLTALLGPACFGGASMLACLCDRRVYLPQTRIATSGPSVIEGVSGKQQLDAGDRDAVQALMGAQARVGLHADDTIIEDSPAAMRDAAARALDSATPPLDLAAEHARLRDRLHRAGRLRPDASDSGVDATRLARVLPAAYSPFIAGRAFLAQPPAQSGKAVFLGAAGAPVDALACWQLSDWLLRLADTHRGSPLVLILDADGHAATVADERVLLSDYLVHLSLSIARLTQAGQRTVLWLPGAASGASYVAFAAPVDRVSALPSARISILPPLAVRQILGAEPAASASALKWIEAGVADALLDSRLQRYNDG